MEYSRYETRIGNATIEPFDKLVQNEIARLHWHGLSTAPSLTEFMTITDQSSAMIGDTNAFALPLPASTRDDQILQIIMKQKEPNATAGTPSSVLD